MKRILLTLSVLLAVVAFTTPAFAVDPISQGLHSGSSWLQVAGVDTFYCPPGSESDTGQVLVGKPYAGFWVFGIADSWSTTPVIRLSLDWRARIKDPVSRDPYWLPWANIAAMTFAGPDTFKYAPVWANDTLGWWDDLQFRVRGTTGNDSSKARYWVVKRYRR